MQLESTSRGKRSSSPDEYVDAKLRSASDIGRVAVQISGSKQYKNYDNSEIYTIMKKKENGYINKLHR